MNESTINSINESTFKFSELFFSQTDLKGSILEWNDVFQRVSEYGSEELRYKPHNLIRHQDMPRAVFYLLWKYLQNGQPVGAFVKNKSKSGKYYWVFALAMPVQNGYLSVRIKPGGDLLNIIEKEYSDLRKIELAQKISPEKSAEILISRIEKMGFEDYSHFMSDALINQMLNRQREQGHPESVNLLKIQEAKKISSDILNITEKIINSFSMNEFVPLNLEIYSQQIGSDAATISVVANQYQSMTTEISEAIEKFKNSSIEVNKKMRDCQFKVGSASLLHEIYTYLKSNNHINSEEKSEYDLIENLAKQYLKQAFEQISITSQIVDEFIKNCAHLNTLGIGLELVRITGKIELARIDNNSDINALLLSLQEFQTFLKTGLKEIDDKALVMQEATDSLSESIASHLAFN